MFPIHKIICPTDFSEPSSKGLEAAIEMAERFSAELIVVHAITPMTTAAEHSLPSAFKDLEEKARKALEKIIGEKVPGTLRSRIRLVYGRPADEIVQAAEDEGADMIVIATHGQTGWARFFFGSVAEKVVRLAECPVLTVRRPRES
jgi:universal stress protein A